MASTTQTNRPLQVFTPLGPDRLLLADFHGHEALSQLFEFDLHLLAPVDQPPVRFEQVLGQPAAVQIDLPGRPARFIHGIARALQQGQRDQEFTHYHLELVPRFWLWTRKVQSRIFQQLSVPDILRQVLAGLRDHVHFELTGTYYPRDYCVQYRESDFAFASRLMEDEGIWYYFQHSRDRHVLVITDTPATCPPLAGDDRVVFEPASGGQRERQRIATWDKRQEIRAGRYTLWDYCFEVPEQDLQVVEPLTEQAQAGTVVHPLRLPAAEELEVYDWPGQYAKRFDGIGPDGRDRPADVQEIFRDNQRTARLRMEEEAAQCLKIQGSGTCGAFVPGCTFRLQRHFDADGQYLLTRVEHQGSATGGFRSGTPPAELDYHNRFTCLPEGLRYRPPRVTPLPHIGGTQTGTVVGPAGEETFLDKHGRVKVQFHWDRLGKKDANSSCWIRVAQIWAGKHWGAFFWPRIGQEVVVAFEKGDPDTPIVIGSVYNGVNRPPFDLPANDLVSGIKSCSAHGDPAHNFNGILFSDRPGEEHAQLHSERHELRNTEATRYEHIGASRVQVVGGFALPGSGGGGGNGSSGSGGAGPFYANADVMGKWAQDLSLVIGEKAQALLGLSGDYVVGNELKVLVNPVSLLAQFSGEAAAPVGLLAIAQEVLKTVGLGIGGDMGFTQLLLGGASRLHYGPYFGVQRGNVIRYQGSLKPSRTDPSSLAALPLAGLAAGLAMASVFLAGLDHRKAYQYPVEFGGTIVANLALSALIALESRLGMLQAAEKKVLEANTLNAIISHLVFLRASHWVADLMANTEARFTDGLNIVNQLGARAAQQSRLALTEAANANKTFAGNFTINAFDISLVSSEPNRAPSSINIFAQGGGTAAKNGSVAINGTGQVLVTSGSASVGAHSSGIVMANAPATGFIQLRQGLPVTGTQLVMYDNGITLQAGPRNVGASISLNGQTGIKLQFAQWTLAINAEGITLQVGPTKLALTLANASLQTDEGLNSLTLAASGATLQGLNIDMQAQLGVSMQGVTLTESFSAEATRKAAISQVM